MKRIVFLFSFLSIQLTAFSQLGVGTNSPDASAQLDVTATDKGFLAPRIALTSTADVTTIATPATGLMVYNTATAGTSPSNVIPGYYYFNGIKWVRFINNQPDATIDFNTANPNSGSPTFTPNTPQSSDYIYVSSVDASQWIWNGSTYVTYTAPASTPWYLANTTNDAGSNKTANIWRSGNVGIGLNNPTFPLDVSSSAINTYVVTARFLAPNNITAGNATMLNFGVSSTAAGNSADWRYIYQGNGAATNRLDFGMSGYAAPMMSYLNNGNVGVGTIAPSAKVHVQGIQATLGANANAQMLRLSRPTWSGFKYGSAAQFNLGTYDDGVNPGNAKSRLDIALTNVADETTLTNVMTWLGNGYVGIGTVAPSAPLVVQGVSGKGSLKLIAPSVAGAGDNWWLGFGHGTTSTDANDRARIGVDIAAGGAGRLFFTTGPTGTQTRAMFIDESQRVGIGTSAPTTRLDVVGGFHLRDIAGVAGTSYGIEFNTNSSAPRIDWVYNGGYIGQFSSDANDFNLRNSKLATGGFRFYTNPAGSSVERLTILNNGNVGVNTIAPTSSLHVTGVITEDVTSQDNFSNGLNIRKRGNSTASTGAVASGAEIGYHSFYGWNSTGYARGAYVFATAAENYTATANGTNYAIFTTANGTTANVERFKIMHNGNVGIGTGNPNGGLTLYGPASLALPTNIQGSTGATKELVFGRGGLYNNFAAITGVDNGQYGGGLSFIVKPTGTDNFPTNAIQAMVLDWNGNMGLGTGSPTQRLDVNGQVRIRTINSGAATDSLLVVNGGVVKSVSRSATVNTQTANYTLTTSDNGAILIMNSSTAVTVTVPATLPAGFVVQIIQKGAGQITVTGSGSTINSANGLKSRTLNSAIGVVMETSTLGYVTGDSNF